MLEEIKTATEHYYVDENGLKQGQYKRYYITGQLEKVGVYKDGKLNGSFKIYRENGQLMVESVFKNGYGNGHFKYYSEDGELEKDTVYKDGKDVTALVNKLNIWNKL